MKNLREDWQDKQGVFEKHEVKDIADFDYETMKAILHKQMAKRNRAKAIEIIDKYNSFLQEVLNDWHVNRKLPDLGEEFLQKYYPKE